MAKPKTALARLLARFPRIRIFLSGLVGIVLRPSLLPYIKKLTGLKLAGPGNAGIMEQEVLDIVKRTVPQGDAQGVLDAMDHFVRSGQGLLINIGDTKAGLVESVVARRQPKVAIELGTYIGYSAISQARKLPPGGKLYGIDPNPHHVRIARELIQHAGLSDKAEVIEAVLETSITALRQRGVSAVDYVLIDHMGSLYLKDLLILQNSGLLKRGSIVVADNVLLPGAPDFRKYLATSADFRTVEHVTDVTVSDYICDIVTVSEYVL